MLSATHKHYATLHVQGGARVRPGLQTSDPSAQLSTPSARATQSGIPRQVVFLPTCVNRMMGAARGDKEYEGSTLEVFTRLANKAGYQVIVPKVCVYVCGIVGRGELL